MLHNVLGGWHCCAKVYCISVRRNDDAMKYNCRAQKNLLRLRYKKSPTKKAGLRILGRGNYSSVLGSSEVTGASSATGVSSIFSSTLRTTGTLRFSMRPFLCAP